MATQIDLAEARIRLAAARAALAEQDGRDDPQLEQECERALRAADELEAELVSPVGVAWVGPFSTGKSLLIGTMLGRPDLLPVAHDPSTGNVTALRLRPGTAASTEVSSSPEAKVVVTFLTPDLVAELARAHIADLLAALGDQVGESEAGALRMLPTVTDQFATVDGWLRRHWHPITAMTEDSSSLAWPPARALLDLRDAVRSLPDFGSRATMLLDRPQPSLIQFPEQRPISAEHPPPRSKALDPNVDDSALSVLFPLIKRITYEVEVPASAWKLSRFGAEGIELLDFPGLQAESTSARDAILCNDQITDAHAIALCLDSDQPRGEVTTAVIKMLMAGGLSPRRIRSALFLVATKFDTIEPPADGDEDTFPLREEIRALEEKAVEHTDRGPNPRHADWLRKLALTSAMWAIHRYGLAEPDAATPKVRAIFEEARRTWTSTRPGWQTVAERTTGPWTSLLAGVAEDGGLSVLRERLATHIDGHGMAEKLRRVDRAYDALEAHLVDVVRADRTIGLRLQPDEAVAAAAFVGGLQEVTLSWRRRSGELRAAAPQLAEISDDARRLVFRWPLWRAIEGMAQNHELPQPEPGARPREHDTTRELRRRFGTTVAGTVQKAASALHRQCTEWLDSAEEELRELHKQWDDEMRMNLTTAVRGSGPGERAGAVSPGTAVEDVFGAVQQLRDLRDNVLGELYQQQAELGEFPLRPDAPQPWADKVVRPSADGSLRHRSVVLRMRTALADQAAEVATRRVREQTARLAREVAGIAGRLQGQLPTEEDLVHFELGLGSVPPWQVAAPPPVAEAGRREPVAELLTGWGVRA